MQPHMPHGSQPQLDEHRPSAALHYQSMQSLADYTNSLRETFTITPAGHALSLGSFAGTQRTYATNVALDDGTRVMNCQGHEAVLPREAEAKYVIVGFLEHVHDRNGVSGHKFYFGPRAESRMRRRRRAQPNPEDEAMFKRYRPYFPCACCLPLEKGIYRRRGVSSLFSMSLMMVLLAVAICTAVSSMTVPWLRASCVPDDGRRDDSAHLFTYCTVVKDWPGAAKVDRCDSYQSSPVFASASVHEGVELYLAGGLVGLSIGLSCLGIGAAVASMTQYWRRWWIMSRLTRGTAIAAVINAVCLACSLGLTKLSPVFHRVMKHIPDACRDGQATQDTGWWLGLATMLLYIFAAVVAWTSRCCVFPWTLRPEGYVEATRREYKLDGGTAHSARSDEGDFDNVLANRGYSNTAPEAMYRTQRQFVVEPIMEHPPPRGPPHNHRHGSNNDLTFI